MTLVSDPNLLLLGLSLRIIGYKGGTYEGTLRNWETPGFYTLYIISRYSTTSIVKINAGPLRII
jgi:hypothetical protein